MSYKHDTIKPFEGETGSKKEQVATMFDQISERYDFLNRFLSVGIDISWRKKGIKQLEAIKPQTILDVATGTGDVAIMIMEQLKPAPQKIIGIDISKGMLEVGRKKIAQKKLSQVIELREGDSEAINFESDSFDAVTIAFGVRNFANLEKGLSEMLRVIRPGGKVVIMEFSKPSLPGIKTLYNLYTRLIAPQAGRIIARNQKAYKYLNDSIQAFPEGKNFVGIMEKCGYVNCYRKPLTLGICTIYCGSKSA